MHLGWLSGRPFAFWEGRYTESPRVGIGRGALSAIRRYTSAFCVAKRYCTMTHDRPRHTVTCEINGKIFRGNYWIAGKILVVSTAKGGKSTQLGSMPAEALAKKLLLKLAEEGKA